MDPINFVYREGNQLKFDLKGVNEICEKVGHRPLMLYVISGLPNTGKSYLLNWFSVYLDKLSKLMENLPEDVKSIDDFNNLINDIDFLKQSEYVQRFKCNEGASGGTTGALLSQPFILAVPQNVDDTIQPNKKELAVLLLDAEGVLDNLKEGRDPEQDQRIFILSALMSSVFIINDATGNRFLSDKTYDFFNCFNGYGARDQQSLEGEESRNKPFQKFVFLKRNWDDLESYNYGFHNNDVPKDKNILKAQLTPENVNDKNVKRLLANIYECFSNVSAFLLPNPGIKLRSMKSVDETEELFKAYLKEFIREMLPIGKADGITLKSIDGCVLTGTSFFLYIKKWISMLENKQEIESMLGEKISKGTAETKCQIAKNEAVNNYQMGMYEKVTSANPPLSDELLRKNHEGILKQSLDIYIKQKCNFWPDIEQHYRREVEMEINRLMDLFFEINRRLNKEVNALLSMIQSSKDFFTNPTSEGNLPREIIYLYHQAKIFASGGQSERAIRIYQEIMQWAIGSTEWRDYSATPDQSNESVYQMTHMPHGYCIIINNENFLDTPPRHGSQADVTGLAMVFHSLGFMIHIYKNLTAEGMNLQLSAISQEDSLNNHDAIVIVILSHGENGFIIGSDNSRIRDEDIFDIFSSGNCRQLHEKPKLFLIQCCRGHKMFGLPEGLSDSDPNKDINGAHASRDSVAISSVSRADGIKLENKNELPLTDAIIWYSTIKDYVSWRNTELGTYFIQAFVKVMNRAPLQQDFLSIALEVNEEVQKNFGKQATELRIIGWNSKLYLKSIALNKSTVESDKIEETYAHPSSSTDWGENIQVIHVEDEELLNKVTNVDNIVKIIEERGINLKIFQNPPLDSVESPVKDQQNMDDLKERYHILLEIKDNENQIFRIGASNLKKQIENIFNSYGQHLISFTRYYIEKISNGPINCYQLENIYRYIAEYPDHSLEHFAVAFGCTCYFDYEEPTNASSSDFSKAQESVNKLAMNSDMTPIHVALASRYNTHNKKVVVEKLIVLGADLSARDKNGNTVLHFSANTNEEIVKILLSDNVITQLSTKDLYNCDEERPHDWATYFGNNEVYKLLFEFYNQKYLKKSQDTTFQPRFQNNKDIQTDSLGSTTFQKFSQKIGLIQFRYFFKRNRQVSLFFHLNLNSDIFPNLKIGKHLINYGVDVNATDTRSNTPLHLICSNNKITEKFHKLRWILLLLTANAETDAEDETGNTALHYLVNLDDKIGVKLLLVFGADPKICNKSNKTAYRLATDENMKKLLDQIGLDVINDKATSTEVSVGSDQESVLTTSTDLTPSPSTTSLIASSASTSSTWPLYMKIGRDTTGSKVLCLDGGGIKGLNTLEILDLIEKMTNKPIIDSFDWIVGTSTGGIIALALAAGRTVRQCKNMYFKLKDKVFGDVWDKITGRNSARLEKILQAEFHDLKMSNLMESKIKVAITSSTEINGKSVLVVYPNYNIPNCEDNYKFKDEYVWRVGRMTSAAPWYFKPIDNQYDGGLIANNPTSDALVQVYKYNKAFHNSDQGLDNVVVASVGTGSWSEENTNTSCNVLASFLKVLKLIIKSATHTEAHVVDRVLTSLPNASFIRLQPVFTTGKIKMDETKTDKLLDMMWETKVFMYKHREEISKYTRILK